MLNQQSTPSREVRCALRRRLARVAEAEAVADGDARGAIEQLRAHFRHAQQEVAVAERLVVGYVHSAQPQFAGRDRLGQRLDVVAMEMRADDHELHLRDVRMTASTLASTMFSPR